MVWPVEYSKLDFLGIILVLTRSTIVNYDDNQKKLSSF